MLLKASSLKMYKTVPFFSVSLIRILVGIVGYIDYSRIVVDFYCDIYFCDLQKAKTSPRYDQHKNNSSTDFSKNFFKQFAKRKRSKFFYVEQKYFCIKLRCG